MEHIKPNELEISNNKNQIEHNHDFEVVEYNWNLNAYATKLAVKAYSAQIISDRKTTENTES